MNERPGTSTARRSKPTEPRPRHTDAVGRGSDDDMVGRSTEAAEDPQVIRQQIERTRGDMSETIDAIQDKLSPRNLVAQAKESVREATVGKVADMASNVGETASAVADQAREAAGDIAGRVKQNPWPAAMIGVGAAWLVMSNSRSRNKAGYSVRREPRLRTAGSRAESYGGASAYAGFEDEPEGIATRASSSIQNLLQRNPIVIGAVAAAVGVAVGLSLPETEQENRLMGDARDTLVERAQEAAGNAVEKVKEVAGEAAGKL